MFIVNAVKALIDIIRVNIRYGKQSFAMAGSVLKKEYSGALFGWAWAIVRPIVFIGVWWFGISFGIRGNKPIIGADGQEIPYILWMIPGVIVWFVFQDVLSKGVSCVRKESHLVTKSVFPVDTIPVYCTMSYFVPHFVMIVISILIFVFSGYGLSLYILQLLFYLIVFIIFSCMVAMLISALGAISRDFEQMVKAILNVVLWLTPILWQDGNFNRTLRMIFKLNPLYYFVLGYRDAFLGEAWFFEHPAYMAYMLVLLLVLGLFTARLQKKLSVDFADVL